ncbi:FMN-dependent NADH-azoreductase [Kineococcus gynurae]|uniref:FMN dependent NADH:quinone oxidoreductase n=1 Tax=Kineococcus gynurae TaxID=452979 RepID=A0ABV5LS00_9ACTN
MPRLLHLDSSADLTGSRSRAITAALAEAWAARGEDYEVVRRDLHTDPLPHIPHPELHWAAADRTAGTVVPTEWETLQRSVIEELSSVDAVVVGAPLYNYTVPSTLKVWLDCIHVPGVMFGAGTEPMTGRPAVVVSSRGAVYDEGTPTEGWDHGVPVLKIILGDALRMDVTVVQTSITLAHRVPDLAGFADRSDAEFAAALDRARELGSTL